MFVYVFAKKFPALASQSCCEVSRPRAVGKYEYRLLMKSLFIYLFIYLFICPCLIQISVDLRTCTEKQLFHSLFVAETSAQRSINEVFPGDLGRSSGPTSQ